MKEKSLDKKIEEIHERMAKDLKNPPPPNLRFTSPEFGFEDFEKHMKVIEGKEVVTIFQFIKIPSVTVLIDEGWKINNFKDFMCDVMPHIGALKIKHDDEFQVSVETTKELIKIIMEEQNIDKVKATTKLYRFLEQTDYNPYKVNV